MRAALVVVLALAAPVRAEPCADEAASLRAHLVEERHRARRWVTLWAIAFGAAAAAQATLALTEYKPFGVFDASYEETLYVGAAKATVGLGARVFLPLRIAVPAPKADACADVASLRTALALASRRERDSFWLGQLGGLGLNLAGVAILTYRRSLAVGLTSFALSFPVGLASAYTQPRGSWKQYRRDAPTWSLAVSGGDGLTVWLRLH